MPAHRTPPAASSDEFRLVTQLLQRDPWDPQGRTLPMTNDEQESRRPVDLDVAWLVPADLSAVDAIARLQVTASRCGRQLKLHGADGGLVELLEFVGLGEVVDLCPCCRPLRQPPREEGRTVRTMPDPRRRGSR